MRLSISDFFVWFIRTKELRCGKLFFDSVWDGLLIYWMYWPDMRPFELLSHVNIRNLASRFDYFLLYKSFFLLRPPTAATEFEEYKDDYFSNSRTSLGTFMLYWGEYWGSKLNIWSPDCGDVDTYPIWCVIFVLIFYFNLSPLETLDWSWNSGFSDIHWLTICAWR